MRRAASKRLDMSDGERGFGPGAKSGRWDRDLLGFLVLERLKDLPFGAFSEGSASAVVRAL